MKNKVLCVHLTLHHFLHLLLQQFELLYLLLSLALQLLSLKSYSSFLRSVSFAVFSFKYWKGSELARLFLPVLLTVFFSVSLYMPRIRDVTTCPSLHPGGHGLTSAGKGLLPLLVIFFAMASPISSSITSFSVGGSGLMPLTHSSLFFLFL